MFEQGMIIQNRYEIIEEVGSGGMSVVYKAKCHVLNRYVAIKVMKPEFSDDTTFVNKFRIEAQSAAGLSHPNIVNVYDVGEENGFYYIVMELVEGITLKEYIQQNGRLPYQTALDFMIQIASGIEAAHEHHTIHRDIKPQNIIVSKNGTLKVTDFGIAKAATSNTVASSAMGSVHYISPEQARGGYSDERSDIYSLGITLYEMLTGRVPFEGENNVAVALMHIQSAMIPPREYYPDIPVGMQNIVLKATQKKPERRYLTTNAMLSDLRKLSIDPNAIVGISSMPTTNNAQTIKISQDELNMINRSAQDDSYMNNNAANQASGISMFPIDHSLNEQEETDQEMMSFYNDDQSDQDDDDDEYMFYDDDDDEDEDEDETENKDDSDEKIEKIITISAIVVTVIIAIGIIVAIVSIARSVRKKEPTTTETTIEETEAIRMINVVGLSEESAVEKLDAAGIAYEIKRVYSDKMESGTVISQSIEEDAELKEGDVVTLEVSKGMEEIDVPDVVGKSLEDARKELENAGFVVEEEKEYDDEVSENYIISQSPEGGKTAAKGATIEIVVSRGKEVKVAKVPDLKKKTVSEAEAALTEVKLTLGNVSQEYSDSVKEGTVISQSIAAGTEVKEETAIDIVISKGKKPTSTAYRVSFRGSINNNGYSFEEGQLVKISLVLKVGSATYTIVDDYYDEAELPLSVSDITLDDLLMEKNGSLTYSVKDESGNDVTGQFSSSVQAVFTAVEQ